MRKILQHTPVKSTPSESRRSIFLTPYKEEYSFASPPSSQTNAKRKQVEESPSIQTESISSSSVKKRTISVRGNKLDFSSPVSRSRLDISHDFIDNCNKELLLNEDLSIFSREDNSNFDNLESIVTVRASELNEWNSFCVWKEHWWAFEPLVELRNERLRFLADGVYGIQLDLGQYAPIRKDIMLVVLSSSAGENKDATPFQFAVSADIYSDKTKLIFLSLRKNECLTLYKKNMEGGSDEDAKQVNVNAKEKFEGNYDGVYPTLKIFHIGV